MVHGSFANTSPDIRVSITFGFHRRKSVLGQRAALSVESNMVYDEQRVFDRSAVIAVAADARAQRFPNQPRFHYAPFADKETDFAWNDANFERVIRDYNTKDLAI